MEAILGEYQGGLFSAMIAVEVEGVDYPRAPVPQDSPVLPIFKTSNLSADQIDAIYEFMWEGHLLAATSTSRVSASIRHAPNIPTAFGSILLNRAF